MACIGMLQKVQGLNLFSLYISSENSNLNYWKPGQLKATFCRHDRVPLYNPENIAYAWPLSQPRPEGSQVGRQTMKGYAWHNPPGAKDAKAFSQKLQRRRIGQTPESVGWKKLPPKGCCPRRARLTGTWP